MPSEKKSRSKNHRVMLYRSDLNQIWMVDPDDPHVTENQAKDEIYWFHAPDKAFQKAVNILRWRAQKSKTPNKPHRRWFHTTYDEMRSAALAADKKDYADRLRQEKDVLVAKHPKMRHPDEIKPKVRAVPVPQEPDIPLQFLHPELFEPGCVMEGFEDPIPPGFEEEHPEFFN